MTRCLRSLESEIVWSIFARKGFEGLPRFVSKTWSPLVNACYQEWLISKLDRNEDGDI